MNDTILFIGLDTHKEFFAVATSREGRDEPVEFIGKIKTNKQAYQKLVRQLHSRYPCATLHFVYEAGPCGYWIYRLLTSMGHSCYITSPVTTSRIAGTDTNHQRTDRPS